MSIKAGLFDMDGVILDTSQIHFIAWKQVLDDFLLSFTKKNHQNFEPFTNHDYLYYVSGKQRTEGIKTFLQSRQINLSLGQSNSSIHSTTIYGLSNKKQYLFLDKIKTCSIHPFSSTIDFIHQLRQRNVLTGVVSSSQNSRLLLQKAGVESLFSCQVDGALADEIGLASKPSPDLFLEAARLLHVIPADTFIVEDALSGVQAGDAGHFGLIIGIDRDGIMQEDFRRSGAHMIVRDMSEIKIKQVIQWFEKDL